MSTGSQSLVTTGPGSPSFGGTGLLKEISGTSAPVRVWLGTCLAEGGSILAVDMTGSTADEVQLVGSLVAQPSAMQTGSDVYLFRGTVTQIAGASGADGALPWGLPGGFVAEMQVQPKAETASLTTVFLQTEHQPLPASASPSAPGGGTGASGGGTGAPGGGAASS